MATYECSICGMSVNATCGKCDAPLVNDTLKLDNGNEVQISKCPNGELLVMASEGVTDEDAPFGLIVS